MRLARFLVTALAIQVGIVGQAWAGQFIYTGALQEFIVPSTGVYSFYVAGAQGGLGQSGLAGLGAVLSGEYLLTAGTKLEIVVGGTGVSMLRGTGGGGGGSFVFITGAAQPLIVAGGGGGGGYWADERFGAPVSGGQITTSGAAGIGPNSGSGGAGGSGGQGGQFFQGQNGGAGGGWLSNGTAGLGAGSGGGGFGPTTFAGGAGGSIIGGAGGYGGGGGGGSSGAGGGGGYSGGGGASAYGYGGGGGGSYIDAGFTKTTLTGSTRSGDGLVVISAQAVPEPSTIITAGLGLAIFAGLRLRGRKTAEGL